jgi:hypothetical protein
MSCKKLSKLIKTVLVKFGLMAIFYRLATMVRGKEKVFVIGFNKTGTTSIKSSLNDLGYIVGDQRKAELLMEDVLSGNYKGLIRYCKGAEAFQDVPFSKPGIFRVMDTHFPNSKFILSIRDNSEQWFESIKSFQTKLKGKNGKTPTIEDYKNSQYVYKGWSYMVHTSTFGEDLFNEQSYRSVYERHVEDVIDYFSSRHQDLLILNVSKKESYLEMCEFLNVRPKKSSFEWKNRTSELIA